MKRIDLTGKRFVKLKVIEELPGRKDGRIVWRCRCDCDNYIDVKGVYLTTGETTSCGCAKKELEDQNLREQYDNKRVDGVVKFLFKGEEPRKDSSTGFRGVSRYYTRKSKDLRYRASITVKGNQYYKSGFLTAEDAYHNGRLMLERKHLPYKKDDDK